MIQTSEEIRAIGYLFKQAKHYLATGQTVDYTKEHRLICFAIHYAGISECVAASTVRAAKEVIMTRLEGARTLRDWLISRNVPEDGLTPVNLQVYRHAWLDSLIEEFSQGGNMPATEVITQEMQDSFEAGVKVGRLQLRDSPVLADALKLLKETANLVENAKDIPEASTLCRPALLGDLDAVIWALKETFQLGEPDEPKPRNGSNEVLTSS